MKLRILMKGEEPVVFNVEAIPRKGDWITVVNRGLLRVKRVVYCLGSETNPTAVIVAERLRK